MTSGPNPNAWRNWYHAVGSTYGTWVRGDPRGFRTYRHAQHIEGDYRQPPPNGVYAPLFEACNQARKHPPVRLSIQQRQLICRAMVERLGLARAEVVALAVCENHFHLLTRYAPLGADEQRRLSKVMLNDGRDPSPRHTLGLARKHASFALSQQNLKPPSPVWAARPKFDPVRDRGHQLNIARYIRRHVDQGGAVFCLPDGFLFE